MSRIFIFDFSLERIKTLQTALEEDGHTVFSNVVINNDKPDEPQLITDVVDVVQILLKEKPFPNIVIAEADKVDGGWLGGLIYDMELGNNTSLVLLAEHENEKIIQLKRLYGAHFWPVDARLDHLLEYIKVFHAVSC